MLVMKSLLVDFVGAFLMDCEVIWYVGTIGLDLWQNMWFDVWNFWRIYLCILEDCCCSSGGCPSEDVRSFASMVELASEWELLFFQLIIGIESDDDRMMVKICRSFVCRNRCRSRSGCELRWIDIQPVFLRTKTPEVVVFRWKWPSPRRHCVYLVLSWLLLGFWDYFSSCLACSSLRWFSQHIPICC